MVHGDDFTFLGEDAHLREMIELMKEWYEITVRGILGGDDGDEKTMAILNRTLQWKTDKLIYIRPTRSMRR